MKNVITISREYGSGGYEIGLKLAEVLGYKFYDKEILTELAEKLMVSESYIKVAEEKAVKRNIFKEIIPAFTTGEGEEIEYIFNEQGKFIAEIAEKGNCIIAGRRADYYLRENKAALHLFFYADIDFRIDRICKYENCSPEEAAIRIKEMDKKRKTSYEYTTGRKWADRYNYDRMICTSSLGIDKCVEEIAGLMG